MVTKMLVLMVVMTMANDDGDDLQLEDNDEDGMGLTLEENNDDDGITLEGNDEDEDEAFLAPENRKQGEAPRTRFRELDSEKQQALVQEAFAYIESISGGNRRKKSGSSNKGKKISKKN